MDTQTQNAPPQEPRQTWLLYVLTLFVTAVGVVADLNSGFKSSGYVVAIGVTVSLAPLLAARFYKPWNYRIRNAHPDEVILFPVRRLGLGPALLFWFLLSAYSWLFVVLTDGNQDQGGFIDAVVAKLERPGGALNRLRDAAQGGKREVSEDPRKELQNMGVSWSNEAFASALLRNDIEVVKMFVAGGWNTKSFGGSGYEGDHLAHYIWRADVSDRQRTHEMLRLLRVEERKGDLLQFRGVRPMSPVANAVAGCNPVVLEWLLKHGHSAQPGMEELRRHDFRLFPPQDGQRNCDVANIAVKLGLPRSR